MLQKKQLSESEIKEIGIETATALGFAHEHGIIHRDVKPGNIFLKSQAETGSGSKLKLLDFGLARDFADSEKLTKTSFLIGTPNYMSPEQCMGKAADARSDIYALGCVLFECATMRKPFEADNDLALMDKHLRQTAAFQNTDRVSAGLQKIVLKCLEKEPANRYQNTSELKTALEGLAETTDARRHSLSGVIIKGSVGIVIVGALSYGLFQFVPQQQKSTDMDWTAANSSKRKVEKHRKRLGKLSAELLKEEGERARDVEPHDYDKSLEKFTAARTLARAKKDWGLATYCLLELCQLKMKQEKYAEAKALLLDSAKEAEKHRRELLPEIYSQLGSVYTFLKEFEASEASYMKSISIASSEISAPRTLLRARIDLANLLFTRKRLNEARKMYKLALRQLDEDSDDSTIDEYLGPVSVMLCKLDLEDKNFENLNETLKRLENSLSKITPRYFVACLNEGAITAQLALEKGQTDAALRIAHVFTTYPRQDEIKNNNFYQPKFQKIIDDAKILKNKK